MRRGILIAVLCSSLLGILDAGYLSISAYQASAPTCFILTGCDVVAASPYSRVFGIPLAYFGLLFYTLIAAVSGMMLLGRRAILLVVLTFLATLGFLMSVWFLYLQSIVIGAFCTYCVISGILSTLLFGLSLVLVHNERVIR